MERVSSAQRARAATVAEAEILRLKDDHALWHKHVHNVELDTMQVLKCMEMDEHPNTVDYSCRRTGKTAVKELYNLKQLATEADQELGIVAPRLAQSQVNLTYMLEAITRSELLKAFVGYDRGRRLMADTYFQFANRSRAQAFGIMANVDGGDMTMASLEEIDDMPADRLFSRFLLMMGANRRLGAAKTSRNDPQIRITGVFKGADTLSDLVAGGHYHVLPTVDCYLGIELGVLNEQFIMQMQDQLSPDEYIRQLLCINVAARNVIWESWVRKAIQTGLKAGVEIAPPVPGETYKAVGPVLVGYDAGGHGEDPSASKHACVVIEVIGSFVVTRYARTWAPGADAREVKDGLMSIFRYFRPTKAIGDAYGIDVIAEVNDHCLMERITDIDRRGIGDGQSVASNWPHWYFSPMRYEGMVQHQMVRAARMLFNNGQAAMPYVDDLPTSDDDVAAMQLLQKQIPNIVEEKTSKAYARYKMANRKIGDDLFDALMGAIWAFANRIAESAPATILISKRSRDELLEARHA